MYVFPQFLATITSYLFFSNNLLDQAGIAVKKSRQTLLDNTEPALVDYVIVHPDYHNTRPSTFLQHDIAVLRLARPILLNDNQAVIALPTPEAGVALGRNAESVKAAGWGYTIKNLKGHPEANLSNQLLQAPVQIISRTACAASWRQLTITENMFCINSTQTDICQVTFIL